MSRALSDERTEVRREEYVIRQYERGDFEEFRALFWDVWGRSPTQEWFAWRYDSPYTERVPMFVVERDGRLVAAEPFVAFRLRAGENETLALQPADAMVHPDHRRNGLLTRMTEAAIEHYRAGEPTMFFNFPNEHILSAYLNLGWTEVGRAATYYRIQNPSALRDHITCGRIADGLAHGYLRARDGLVSSPDDVSIERHDSPPADILTELYEQDVPERIHANRDRAYYRWRFANPNWDCRTYVARTDEPVAALVVCTISRNGTTYTRIMDAQPLSNPPLEAFAGLLQEAVSDYRTADVVAVADGTLPHEVLARCGFHRDDRLPLSVAAERRPLVVRPLARNVGTVCGERPTDRSNWLATFGEQDGIY